MIRSHSLPARTFVIVSLLAASLAMVLALAPAPAAAKVSQPNCGKQKAMVKRSKGKAKVAAKRSLKQCLRARTVYNQVKNSHFYGYRADGILIDSAYCANGKFQGDVALGSNVEKGGWYVNLVSFRNAKNYEAQIIGKIKGGTRELGIARNGAKWQVGYTYFDENRELGDAEKRDAKALCAKL